MNIAAIIQARQTSTRLPGKTMRLLSNRPLLQYTIDNLRRSKNIDEIIVATTTDNEDDLIASWCQKNSICFFRGDREDVLSRFYGCAVEYEADAIVRVTSDCPLVDPQIVDNVIELFKRTNADYSANNIEKSFPHGLDVEVFGFEALKDSFENATKLIEREHVTQFIRNQPEKFKITNFSLSENYNHIRVTVDEEEDFRLVELIIQKIGKNPTLSDLLNLYDLEPDLFNINVNAKSRHKDYYEKENII